MRLPVFAAVFASLTAFAAQAEPVTVKVAARPDGSFAYYQDLLQKAFAAGGVEVKLEQVPDLPQTRIVKALDDGDLTVHQFVQSAERDGKWAGVPVGLTNGLIGRRILFIRPGDQEAFSGVKSIADLKALDKAGGFGKGWYDVSVWQANGLKVTEIPGEWNVIYKMLAAGGRNIDYFSRGVIEILGEAPQQPDLAVEKSLVLVYDRDLVFYVSKAQAELAAPLEAGLKKLKADGTIDKMVQQYWGDTFKQLDLEKRTVINLANPS
ncbi:MAG TPA: transporter substrate-binding domain-containing protein [Alphaproteobacteria bacterium]|nr:transporter substrate-binding domain-containing protein [Alphaproteobacteria bacterium]